MLGNWSLYVTYIQADTSRKKGFNSPSLVPKRFGPRLKGGISPDSIENVGYEALVPV
jgi:hypothetical protein